MRIAMPAAAGGPSAVRPTRAVRRGTPAAAPSGRGRIAARAGLFAVLAAALLATVAAPPAAADVIGAATVIDGDTIEIHGRRIRLFGIDAPESAQLCEAAGKAYRCGQRAALALADEIGRATVDCDPHDVDRYGRIVAVCTAAGRDLNAWMVRQGWALAYRQYSRAYVSEEEAARTASLGLWRGTFTAP